MHVSVLIKLPTNQKMLLFMATERISGFYATCSGKQNFQLSMAPMNVLTGLGFPSQL